MPLAYCAAYDFVSNGIYYNIAGEQVFVTQGDNLYSGDIVLPSSVTYNGKTYTVTSILSYAFSGDKITSVNIPNTVTTIYESAFENCTGLTSIVLGNSVNSIGAKAFANCTNLESINIPNSVGLIDEQAFAYCSKLTSVIIPNSVTRIEDRAFFGCSGMTALTIGSSVTNIGNFAFQGCSSLTTVDIPESVSGIGTYVFSSCTSLTSVSLPALRIINTGMFSNCTNLTYVDIPSSVLRIYDEAFSGCTSLASVNIPNSVISIERNAFSECTSLKYVDIPSSVSKIMNGAFSGCTSLAFVHIPSSVSVIEDYAFNGCDSLNEVEVDWEIPLSISDNVFSNYETCSCVIPLGSEDAYAADPVWSKFSSFISEESLVLVTIKYGNIPVVVNEVEKGIPMILRIPDGYTKVTFNGEDVTEQIAYGEYVTPDLMEDSELSIEFDAMNVDTNNDGQVDSQDALNVYEYMRTH